MTAVLACFQKIDEAERTVSHPFGETPEAMTGTLELDKETGRVIPEADPTTYRPRAAAGKTTRLFRDEGTWPQTGMTAR